MITSSYKIACSQVVKTLEYMPEWQLIKIPHAVVEYYKRNMDKEYSFEINTKFPLSKQQYSKEAAIILTAISKKYLLDENENKKIDEVLKENSIKLENQKRELYNPDEIFKKNAKDTLKSENIDTQMIEYKESIFTKIVKFFKNMFRK